MNFLDAAYDILVSAREPLHYADIAQRALAQGLITSSGLTPEATMASRLYMDTKRPDSRFVRADRGVFALARRTQADDIGKRVEALKESTRKQLRDLLHEMPPDRFEVLIGELLLRIGFEESTVEVSQYSNDGGIDVRGILSAGGLTKINAAVQVKRWKGNVQAPTVRAVRGALTAQEQGIIITTSGFSKGAREEAYAFGKTPISLVDGEMLLDMLFEHSIGVNRTQHTVFSLDSEWWQALGEDTGFTNSVANSHTVTDEPPPAIKVRYPLRVRAINAHLITAELLDAAGNMRFNGQIYSAPSTAGKDASGWKSTNGWIYWQFQHPETAEWQPIDLLRQTGSDVSKSD